MATLGQNDQKYEANEAMRDYLVLDVAVASDGVYSIDESGNFTDIHTYWKGFLPRTAIGLELHRGSS